VARRYFALFVLASPGRAPGRFVRVRRVGRSSVVTIALGLILCQGALPAAGATELPSGLLASILKAGDAEKAVRYVSSFSDGPVSLRQVADVGASQGVQHTTYTKSGRSGHVTVLVISNTAYLRGDAFALANYNGLPSAIATKYADVWIMIPRTSGAYATVTAGVTLPSTIAELNISGVIIAVPPTSVSGQRVVGVKGTSKDAGQTITITLFARASSSPLPVEELTARGAVRGSVVLSKWNETVDEPRPAHSVSISNI
jgi:hypothetical protein